MVLSSGPYQHVSLPVGQAREAQGAKLYLNDESELTTDNTGTPAEVVEKKAPGANFWKRSPDNIASFRPGTYIHTTIIH